MVPADAVAAAIDDCCGAGVPVATIYSDGFAETGADGLRRQQALVEAARKGGIRLIGPNSMGVIDVHAGSPLTVNAVLEIPHIKAGPLGGYLAERHHDRRDDFARSGTRRGVFQAGLHRKRSRPHGG